LNGDDLTQKTFRLAESKLSSKGTFKRKSVALSQLVSAANRKAATYGAVLPQTVGEPEIFFKDSEEYLNKCGVSQAERDLLLSQVEVLLGPLCYVQSRASYYFLNDSTRKRVPETGKAEVDLVPHDAIQNLERTLFNRYENTSLAAAGEMTTVLSVFTENSIEDSSHGRCVVVQGDVAKVGLAKVSNVMLIFVLYKLL
jgi:hypothetical protein